MLNRLQEKVMRDRTQAEEYSLDKYRVGEGEEEERNTSIRVQRCTESEAKRNSKSEINMKTKIMVKSAFQGIEIREKKEKGSYKYPESVNTNPLSWLFEEMGSII